MSLKFLVLPSANAFWLYKKHLILTLLPFTPHCSLAKGMETHRKSLAILFLAVFLFISSSHPLLVQSQLFPIINDQVVDATQMQTYIVHVQKSKGTKFLHFRDKVNWYLSFLPNSTLDSGEPRMLYAYRHVISGFAARLTPEEVEAMEAMDGFVLAHRENEYVPTTTYTPKMLGLPNQWGGLWYPSTFGQGKVIGVIDTGIDPTHPSFQDDGMPPPPTYWSGSCYWGPPLCNNKLIGAAAFWHGRTVNPKDHDGHGTHVAGTAAGNFVEDAQVLGQANGTASGMAPRAHLAIYKVLHNFQGKTSGLDSDILKGIDQAIRDDVDILSMSLGTSRVPDYNNGVAKGSFAAMTRGIVPCAAAANDGPFKSIMANDAPWILTVGASTVSRRIQAIVRLGNGMELHGESAYQPESFESKQLPLVYPCDLLNTNDACGCNVSMANLDVQDKIVLCWKIVIEDHKRASIIKNAGGAAMIVMNVWQQGETTGAETPALPASNVPQSAAKQILQYLGTAANATATIIFNGTQFGASPTPAVASFSSRGPSLRNGGIIKPDIIAPGVNILAAWPWEVGPNPTGTSKTFDFLSGTSMATPHVSGVVALLKNTHPNWSPAAIKSALMTTANRLDDTGNPIADQFNDTVASVFAMGSGHINPVAANDPGLIYDIHYYDYVHYLCGLGRYTDRQVSAIVRGRVNCSQVHQIRPEDLNYPSIMVNLGTSPSSTTTVSRTVTNVGDADSVYTIEVEEPEGVRVDVTPATLQFSQVDQEQSFDVTFSHKGSQQGTAGEILEGQLKWVSGKYLVRSPIAVTFL